MKSLFTIIFKDGSNFSGGTYMETKWTEIPDKPIKRIIYSLPTGDNLVLNNCSNYFHMTEVTTDLSGKNKGTTKLEFDYILGLKNKMITSYRIALFQNSEHAVGDITIKRFSMGSNFIKKLNSCGWKPILK